MSRMRKMSKRRQVDGWSPDGAGWYVDGYDTYGVLSIRHVKVNKDYGVEVTHSTDDYSTETLLSVEILTALLDELGYDVRRR